LPAASCPDRSAASDPTALPTAIATLVNFRKSLRDVQSGDMLSYGFTMDTPFVAAKV
jgi:hypothetical protein